ncbi:MAG: aminotransferase class I/II-fold pyridoxal phosphate-dependent enzyme [Lachnospiraceae bacterium]|nr:aminotransferase class I/II-fold pyridoxal phosphate-dependent enzyme [Lachnospiraceae bacterium]
MTKQEFLNRYLVERKGTDSLKWDALGERFGQDDLIAMWVADMEFKTCDSITEALKRRVEHGVYGYSRASDAYYQAYADWMERRHHGDACLILTPVYYPFHNAVKDNGRRLICVDLDAADGRFTMNYEAIEKAIVENHVKLFLLCSPHNPAGRVWSEEELNQVLAICRRHNVLVCSDEIHQDFTFNGNIFVPALMVGGGKYRDRLITVNSASKTFNLASLLHAQLIISDERLRATYDREIRGRNQTELSIMGLTAAQAGYEGGEEWLEALKEVIWDNFSISRQNWEESCRRRLSILWKERIFRWSICGRM